MDSIYDLGRQLVRGPVKLVLTVAKRKLLRLDNPELVLVELDAFPDCLECLERSVTICLAQLTDTLAE